MKSKVFLDPMQKVETAQSVIKFFFLLVTTPFSKSGIKASVIIWVCRPKSSLSVKYFRITNGINPFG